MIISASRRTDIPAYYSEWLMKRLQEGYVLTRNPINRSQVSRIFLSPELIDCIVFWTKDPFPMMDKLSIIDSMGYPYYFQFTLTPYGNEIERNLRDKKAVLETFRQLSDQIGREKVIWRYDPILLNDQISQAYHLEQFEILCSQLQGYTDSCTISFVDLYGKLGKSVKEHIVKPIPEEQIHQLAAKLSQLGNKFGISLNACSEKSDLSIHGIKPAACIDKNMVEQICGHRILAKKDKSQRLECGCVQSVDIGVYNTCSHGCVYCYANHSDASIRNNYLKHDPNSDILIGSVGEEEKITDRSPI